MVCLKIDDDYVTLKKRSYLVIGKSIEDIVESRSLFIKIANELMPNNKNILNACHNMQRSIVMKHKRSYNKVIGENTSPLIVKLEEDNIMQKYEKN